MARSQPRRTARRARRRRTRCRAARGRRGTVARAAHAHLAARGGGGDGCICDRPAATDTAGTGYAGHGQRRSARAAVGQECRAACSRGGRCRRRTRETQSSRHRCREQRSCRVSFFQTRRCGRGNDIAQCAGPRGGACDRVRPGARRGASRWPDPQTTRAGARCDAAQYPRTARRAAHARPVRQHHRECRYRIHARTGRQDQEGRWRRATRSAKCRKTSACRALPRDPIAGQGRRRCGPARGAATGDFGARTVRGSRTGAAFSCRCTADHVSDESRGTRRSDGRTCRAQ